LSATTDIASEAWIGLIDIPVFLLTIAIGYVQMIVVRASC